MTILAKSILLAALVAPLATSGGSERPAEPESVGVRADKPAANDRQLQTLRCRLYFGCVPAGSAENRDANLSTP